MQTTIYWCATIILAFVLLSGGAAEIAHRPETVAGMTHLGYPLYFTVILGVWKLLGGAVILAPRLPRLKEWAYAGAVFDLTGASVSHAVCGDNAAHLAVPLFFTACALVSWALRPESRRIGTLVPQRAGG
ncbi:hypothetical protein CCAX7_009910 [Capsulimonas corticalis]|uniref:Uncharacterized protein n=1 Tax=Capsulimonas corticalis TaxID=2219043 RepID=A0A402CUD7_9BACT|nr:DoxX family protein [Capsulimonas corticalis]BDI28940.1 hypothetical protein CCAX7_009910 [Capsulimonas corticalis]